MHVLGHFDESSKTIGLEVYIATDWHEVIVTMGVNCELIHVYAISVDYYMDIL